MIEILVLANGSAIPLRRFIEILVLVGGLTVSFRRFIEIRIGGSAISFRGLVEIRIGGLASFRRFIEIRILVGGSAVSYRRLIEILVDGSTAKESRKRRKFSFSFLARFEILRMNEIRSNKLSKTRTLIPSNNFSAQNYFPF